MLEAAKQLSDSYQTHILIKGGHLEGDQMCDLLYSSDHTYYIYEEKKIESKTCMGPGVPSPPLLQAIWQRDTR